MVSDVARLSEGDHIVTDDGLSGIVVGVGEKMAQLEIVQFPSEQKRGPGRLVINDVIRHDQTLAFTSSIDCLQGKCKGAYT